MTRLSILCAALCVGLSTVAVDARGGMSHSSATGGAFGSRAGAPGTNSLGTALSSSGTGNGPIKGPLLGTGNPAVDREDAKVARIVHSICHGC